MDHGAWQLFGNLSSAFLSKSQEKDWHDCSQSCCTPMPLEVQVAQASIYTHTAYGWMAPSWMAPGWTTHCRHHLGHHELMNSWNSKWAPIWDTLTSLPGRSKNGLWERLANHQSCGARHADNIGPSFFPAQNTLASRAGKSVVFFRSQVYLNAPWIIHVKIPGKMPEAKHRDLEIQNPKRKIHVWISKVKGPELNATGCKAKRLKLQN